MQIFKLFLTGAATPPLHHNHYYMKQKKKLQVFAKSDTGRVRNLNEDSIILTSNIHLSNWNVPTGLYKNDMGTLVAIADGMGGANAGEVASRIAVESMRKYFQSAEESFNGSQEICNALKESIVVAHQNICNHAASNRETAGMGTTVIALWLLNDTAYIAWVGDSRCYYYRQGKELSQLSKDHSLVQDLIDNKVITKEKAFNHPQSHIILQSLGDKDAEPKPDITIKTVKHGDTFLLCSDGLNSMLTDVAIKGILDNKSADINSCVETLISEANRCGGFDNITVALIKVIGTRGSSEDAVNFNKVSFLNKIFPGKRIKWQGKSGLF